MPRSSRAARAPNGCTECAPFGSASNTVMCSTTSCRPYSLRHCATGWRCRQGSQGSGADCGSASERGEVMDWARILAYITGTVDQELLLRNEYLVAENR